MGVKTFQYLLLALLLLWELPGFGQIKMASITVDDGLSQGFVNSMIQDQRGFIWLGTYDGLNRYDGYQVKRFLPKPFDQFSLRSTYVTALYEDSRSLLWVGTYDGLYIFDPYSERFCFIGAPNLNVPAQYVRSINGNSSGEVIVVFDDRIDQRQLFKFNVQPEFVEVLNNGVKSWAGLVKAEQFEIGDKQSERIYSLICVGDSLMLLGSWDGPVYKVDTKQNQLYPYDLSRLPASNTFDHNIIWDKNQGYVFRCKSAEGKEVLISPRHWRRVHRFGNGDIGVWYAERGPLLKKNDNKPLRSDFTRAVETLSQEPCLQEEFTEILKEDLFWSPSNMVDRGGIFWAATSGWGVRKINLNQLAFSGAMSGHSISTLHELPDGNIWVRTYSDTTFTIDRHTLKVLPRPTAQDPYMAYDIMPDEGNSVWRIYTNHAAIGHRRLFFQQRPNTPMIQLDLEIPFEEGVPERLFKDREGNVWIAACQGLLFRARPHSFQFEKINYGLLLPESARTALRSIDIKQDPSGDIWVGSNKGLVRVGNHNAAEPQLEIFQHHIDQPGSISSDWVNCILPDPGNTDLLWVGTRGGGLNRLSISERRFTFIAETPNGFPDNVVYGILSDNQGNLWCSTNHGICRFNPAQNTFVTYLESDGLLNTEFNTRSFLRTRDGRLWFGGVSGLNVFHPEHIQNTTHPLQVTITEIKVQGKPRLPDRSGTMVLEHDENNISFEFSAMDYTNPATNRYRYRLNGDGDDWVYNGKANVANFAALAPGLYVFEVQGATADGAWSAEPVRFTIRVRPPWYNSNLACILYFLMIAGAIFGYIRYREMMIKLEHAAEASRQESIRLKEFEGIKNQFFANIAHELRTPLTVILGLANRLRQSEKPGDINNNAGQIINQSEQLLHLSNQVLDLAKLEHLDFELHLTNGNINEYIRQHTNALKPLAASKGVELQNAQQMPDLWMDFDPGQLQKVINNLVSNAIRHTPPGGSILVSMQLPEGESMFQLSVSDSGVGIEPDDLPHIFDRFYQSRHSHHTVGASGIGLTLTRDLIHLMGGTIQVESIPGHGANFTVLLPVKTQAPKMTASPTVAHPPAYQPAQVPKNSGKTDFPLLLVVEDNQAVAEYLELCLGQHYQLIFATDGAAGIEKALELIPDLILTDVAMPIKSGYELMAVLKNDPRTSHIPIAMLSAKTEQTDRIEGHRYGANAYVAKPFVEQELLLVLQNLLQLQVQWKARYKGYWTSEAKPHATNQPEEAVQAEDQFMRKLHDLFEANYTDDGFNLEKLCQLLNMSSSQLDRKLRALTEESPMQMLRNFRLNKARLLIQQEPYISIKEVCFRTGFKSPAHFSRLYAKVFGAPPSRE
jgi:signal transduction histidine kinase/DNA-binding response OmpR family regulator/ligand-binding sensor domain-containing protein